MSDKFVTEHFNFCPSCGSSSVELKNGNCITCSDCDFLMYFNPTSSAGALIFDDEGKLLVIERANAPSKGKYGIPGGFADYGERLEEVVVRETKEETNLDIANATFFASFPNEYHYRGVIYGTMDTYWEAHVHSFDDIVAEEGEVAGIHLVDPTKVPAEKWAFPSLKNAIAKYLAELPK
ncbi:NUDIX domain-containing protein [Pelagicoccus mobilis]|uniref:NUDIX domain-containing protein n=1 Tax=Pelagicoccus mobilis TaxID=415221 RepID=A0A934VRA1_9BACT|nr:NUDIX domain-containing protein [Pelagicoccus mobilis]MBK1877715.1 NUDIX domain-containing protein [Pelagicoccus mobilis]